MKLVDDWRRGIRLKWASVRWQLGHIGFNVVVAKLVSGFKVALIFVGYVHLVWIPVIGIALTVGALIARFLTKSPKDNDETDDTDAPLGI